MDVEYRILKLLVDSIIRVIFLLLHSTQLHLILIPVDGITMFFHLANTSIITFQIHMALAYLYLHICYLVIICIRVFRVPLKKSKIFRYLCECSQLFYHHH